MSIDPTNPALSTSIPAEDEALVGRWSSFGAESLRRFWRRLSAADLVSYFLSAVFGLLMTVSLVIYPRGPSAGAGLDSSYGQAYSHFFTHGYQCGRDYTFTYGPLAPFIMQVYDRDLSPAACVVGFAFTAALSWIFLRYSALLSPRRMQVYFLASIGCTLALIVRMFTSPPDCVLSFAIVAAFVGLTAGNQNASTVRHIILTFFLAALSLYKVTLLLLSVVAVLFLALHLLNRRKPLAAILVCVAYVVAFGTGWMLLGQSLVNVPAFLISAWELTVGFQEAMSVGGHTQWLAFGVISLVLFIAGIFPRTREDLRYLVAPRQICMLSLLAAALYLNWKHAFTRIDNGHTLDFFWSSMAFVFLPFVALPGYNWKNQFRLFPLRACWILNLVLIVGVCAPPQGLSSVASTARTILSMRVQYVLRPYSLRSQMEQCRQALAAQWSVPRMKARIGHRSVDLFSYDQGLLFLNDLNWAPRPVFQSYSAYTPRLLRANADHFRGKRAPDFVILKSEAIDRHLSAMEDGLAFQEVLWHYKPVLTERVQGRSYLLLERSQHQEEPQAQVVDSRSIRFGEHVALQQAIAACHVVALKIELSAVGQLRKLAYQAPPIELHVRVSQGLTRTYRLVRGMSETGFVLDPLLESDSDLLAFYSRNEANHVTSFWLTSPAPRCYSDRIALTVTKCAKPSSASYGPQDLQRITAN